MSGNKVVMEGRGFYNAHSQLQHSALRCGLPFLEQALASVPIPQPGHPFLVADYGSSEGRNSVEVMRLVVREIRRRASWSVPISIVHIDQPGNDFSSLFDLLHSSPNSYLRDTSDVFAYATGGSFYDQLFPQNQVSLGWSAIAIHWLSRLPEAVPHHIGTNHAPPQLKRTYAEQARQDWRRFLEHRAQELQRGARLVVLAGAADVQGRYGGEPLYEVANHALQELVRDGLLHAGEYARMTVPTYHRTQEEFAEPLRSEALRGRLVLEGQSQVEMADPIWERYSVNGDMKGFAVEQTAWLRAWSEPSLFRDLDPDRTPEVRQAIIEAFYTLVRELILRDPPSARCAWRLAVLLIAKA